MEKYYNSDRFRNAKKLNDNEQIKIMTKKDAMNHAKRLIVSNTILSSDVISVIFSFLISEGYNPHSVPQFSNKMRIARRITIGRHFCGVPYGVWRICTLHPYDPYSQSHFMTSSVFSHCKRLFKIKCDILKITSFNSDISDLLVTEKINRGVTHSTEHSGRSLDLKMIHYKDGKTLHRMSYCYEYYSPHLDIISGEFTLDSDNNLSAWNLHNDIQKITRIK